jgi:hypothetical protein
MVNEAFSKLMATDCEQKICLREIFSVEEIEPLELFHIISKECYNILELRKEYEEIYRKYKIINIPVFDKNTSDLSKFHSIMNSFESDASLPIETIVFAILEQIDSSSAPSDFNSLIIKNYLEDSLLRNQSSAYDNSFDRYISL